ncbi:MAG: DUF5658 family protein [Pseudomonadota bacterium]
MKEAGMILFGVFVLLNIADVWTTVKVLRGAGRELNPVARWFIERLGIEGGLVILKLVLVLAVIWGLNAVLWCFGLVYVLLALGVLCAVYVVVVAHNFRTWKRITLDSGFRRNDGHWRE